MPAGESKNEAPFTTHVSADPGLAVANREISRYYAGVNGSPPVARGASGLGTGVVLMIVLAMAGLGGLALVARRGGFVKVS